jgi:hypothetical protein
MVKFSGAKGGLTSGSPSLARRSVDWAWPSRLTAHARLRALSHRSQERDDQEHPRTGGRGHQDQAKLPNDGFPGRAQGSHYSVILATSKIIRTANGFFGFGALSATRLREMILRASLENAEMRRTSKEKWP